jgi:hypothetical protein
LVIDCQRERAGFSAQLAVVYSVMRMVDERSDQAVKLCTQFVSSARESAFERPLADDLMFVASPGGHTAFRLLRRLGLLRSEFAIAGSTSVVSLTATCREFVSADTFANADARMRNLLSSPATFGTRAARGIAAFQRARRMDDELRRHVPVMAAYVMTEGAAELPRNGHEWLRYFEAQGAAEALETFATAFVNTPHAAALTQKLIASVVHSRPVLLLRGFQSATASPVHSAYADNLRQARKIPPFGDAQQFPPVTDFVQWMVHRNARHVTSLDSVVSGALPANAGTVDDLARLFGQQSLAPTYPYSLTFRVPFAAGDSVVQIFRVPQSTALSFDTVPIDLGTLLMACRQLQSDTATNAASARIRDRSATLLDTTTTATDPYSIDVTVQSTSFVTVNTIMSQSTAFRPPGANAVRSSTDPLTSTDVAQLVEDTREGKLEGIADASSPDDVYEITWNAERIVQASLVGIGAHPSFDPEGVFDVEIPVGWVLSRREWQMREVDADSLKQEISRHRDARRGVAEGFFDALWSAVVEIRTDTNIGGTGASPSADGTSATPPTAPSAAPAAAPAEPPATEAAAAPVSAPVPQQVDAELTDRVDSRPPRSKSSTRFPDGRTLSQLFESPPGELVDEFVQYATIPDAFVRPEAGDYYTANVPVVRALIQSAFDDAVLALQQYVQKSERLADKQRSNAQNFNSWVDRAIGDTGQLNQLELRRVTAAVALAQTILLQSTGPASPRLRLVETLDSDASRLRIRQNVKSVTTQVLSRIESACAACEKSAVKWLSLGELARILASDDDSTPSSADGSASVPPVPPPGSSALTTTPVNPPVSGAPTPPPLPPLGSVSGSSSRLTRFANWIRTASTVYFFSGEGSAATATASIGRLIMNNSIPSRALVSTGDNANLSAQLASGWLSILAGTYTVATVVAWCLASTMYRVNAGRLRLTDATAASLEGDGELDADAVAQLQAAGADLVDSGTLAAMERSVAAFDNVAVDDFSVFERCNDYEDRPLFKELCYLLGTLGFTDPDPKNGLLTFSVPADASDAGRLRIDRTALKPLLEQYGVDDVGLALNTLFGLRLSVSWTLDGERFVVRELESYAERRAYKKSRDFLALENLKISLATGVVITVVFAFLAYLLFGAPLSDGLPEDAVGDLTVAYAGPVGPNGPWSTTLQGFGDAPDPSTRPDLSVRLAATVETLWVRATGATDPVIPRLRYVFTGYVDLPPEEDRPVDGSASLPEPVGSDVVYGGSVPQSLAHGMFDLIERAFWDSWG